MQFKVPQFLDIEDKIFGPFTFRQFAYLAGGGGLCFVIYKAMPLYIGIFIMLPVLGMSLALTFYRINNKPFIFVLESAFRYAIADKLYIWKRRLKKPGTKKEQEEAAAKKQIAMARTQRLGTSRLKDLAWSLDVLDLKKEKQKAI